MGTLQRRYWYSSSLKNKYVKAVSTPIERNHNLGREEDDSAVDRMMYQRLVGRSIYLSHARPDIAFDVSTVSQFMQDPNERHLQAMHGILR